MAFVNEYVSDSDKENVLFKRKSPFPPNYNVINPYVWTIDRERDFILVKVGGSHPERPDIFVFQWRGVLGAVEANVSFKQIVASDSSFAYDVYWQIELVYLPENLSEDADCIISILCEAFERYGLFSGQVRVRSIDVRSDGCGVSIGGGYATF